MTQPTRPRPQAPSKRWYRLSWSLVALGLLAAAAWFFYGTNRVYDAVEEFDRLPPFGGKVTLDEGTHTFWVEGTCLSCHDNEPADYRAASTVSITGPDGEEIAVRDAPSRVYNTARREGRSLWLFDADEPGAYRIAFDLDTSADDWNNVVPDNIAIGEGTGLPVGIVRPMVYLAGSCILVATVIIVVTFVRRRRYYDIPIDERS